ncbi:MAG: amidohydrolase family protein [Cyclobacteriaceae bacterium]
MKKYKPAETIIWISLLIGLYYLMKPLLITPLEEAPTDTADFVIQNARVWTGNSYQPWAESVAVKNDTIAAVGSTLMLSSMIGDDTQVIDAHGHMVTPGFIDNHVHFYELGLTLTSVQLRDAKTPEEFIKRIAEFAKTKQPGEWILGGTWDHENWGGELPQKSWIDSVTTDNPVFISRLDGHMTLCNTAALQAANITSETPDVEGGSIVRDESGDPTGILKDNAMSLVYPVVPEPSLTEQVNTIRTAMDHVASNGVTSVTHVGGNIHLFEVVKLRHLAKTRFYIATPLANWEDLKQRTDSLGFGDDWLKIGALKGMVDGSLGSHTAKFFDGYSDIPGDSGLYVMHPDTMIQYIRGADAAGLHVMVHAIGDKANHELLNIFETVTEENGPRDRRFKIEHAQHLTEQDIARFSDLGVIASMQPYHAIDDGRWADRIIGQKRIKTTYAFRSLLDAGAAVAFGSDAPVAPPTPLEGIYAAVTRQTLDGANPDGWVPAQKISVEEALYAYTVAGAYATFDEDKKGSIEVGKLADMVIIDTDITAISPDKIKEAKVLRTFVGGRMVFHRDE